MISGFRPTWHAMPILTLFLAIAFVAAPVHAQEITTLYSGDIQHCEAPGLENLFSGFVCSYQQIVDQIMTELYLSLLDFFTQPFFATVTLFVITVGVSFGMGLLPFTTRDIMVVLAKIAIISGFAMYPELLIDLLYNGLIGFMRQATDTVVQVMAPQGSVAGIFEWMDQVLFDFISTQDAAQTAGNCENDLLAVLFGLAITMPPIFAVVLYLLVQLVMVLVRTVLGYVLAMTGIMFLTTLAPLFFAFAFFKFTKSYFEKWLSYLIGFAMQIFIVFAFIAAMLSLPFESKLQGVMDTIRPYERVAYHDGQRLDFNNWCTICASAAVGSPTEADTCTGDPITPTNVQVGGIGEFIDWVGQEILILAVMAYIVESVLKAAPDIAKYISSIPYAPSALGRLPVPDNIGNAGNNLFTSFRDTPGGLHTRTGNALRDSFNTLISGRP